MVPHGNADALVLGPVELVFDWRDHEIARKSGHLTHYTKKSGAALWLRPMEAWRFRTSVFLVPAGGSAATAAAHRRAATAAATP